MDGGVICGECMNDKTDADWMTEYMIDDEGCYVWCVDR